MIRNYLLTPLLLARETVMLLRQQIKPDEPACMGRFRTTFDVQHLTWCIEKFSGQYLAEAADTIAAINWQIKSVPFLPEERGLSSRQTWGNVTARLALDYDPRNDIYRMQIDAAWNAQG